MNNNNDIQREGTAKEQLRKAPQVQCSPDAEDVLSHPSIIRSNPKSLSSLNFPHFRLFRQSAARTHQGDGGLIVSAEGPPSGVTPTATLLLTLAGDVRVRFELFAQQSVVHITCLSVPEDLPAGAVPGVLAQARKQAIDLGRRNGIKHVRVVAGAGLPARPGGCRKSGVDPPRTNPIKSLAKRQNRYPPPNDTPPP